MRWTIGLVIVAVALWVGYAAWPIWAVYDLAGAVQRRDSAAINSRVNFPAVRRSLTEQIVATHLQVSGKDVRLGEFTRGMAVAAIASAADPIVAQLVSAEALIELLHNGWPPSLLREQPAALQGLGAGSLGNVWQLFIHSEHGLRTFAFAVPATSPAQRRFTLQFRLTTWMWKLSAIELPEELRLRLAHELAKQISKR